ncbi:MAG: hypothetical protein JNL11_03240 [Bdellovibrionaceae bacterium]|nr:hypothetical protein [Pseudobdellovibrionaceae bacterium]
MVPGSANNIIILARAGKREHLEALQKGKLRASHIGNYKKEEDRGKPFFDENEAVDAIFDPEKIVIKLKKDDQEIAELIPDPEQKLKIFRESNIPALCFFSLHTGLELAKPIPQGQKGPITIDKHLQVTDHISKFGNDVFVIENVREFHNRLNMKATELGIAIRHGLVEYQDLNSIHGKIPSNKWGLVKDLFYMEEREYRYIFISKERLPDPYFFEVGDLTDISQIMPMDQFKKSYQVTIEYENNGKQKSES